MKAAAIFANAFLDGFTFGGLVHKPRIPGSPTQLFAEADADTESEPVRASAAQFVSDYQPRVREMTVRIDTTDEEERKAWGALHRRLKEIRENRKKAQAPPPAEKPSRKEDFNVSTLRKEIERKIERRNKEQA